MKDMPLIGVGYLYDCQRYCMVIPFIQEVVITYSCDDSSQ